MIKEILDDGSRVNVLMRGIPSQEPQPPTNGVTLIDLYDAGS